MAQFAFAASAATVFAASAFATVTPGTLYGDSYIVKEGAGASAKFYSVMDVYIGGNNTSDIGSSTFGVTLYKSSYVMNQGDAWQHNNISTGQDAWKPVNANDNGWDSFVTTGGRSQNITSGTYNGETRALDLSNSMALDTNWAGTSNSGHIDGVNGGAGWYPGIGANPATTGVGNFYAYFGYYNNKTDGSNTAKAAGTIAGNGITAGQNLNNKWMIGRFTIEVTGLAANTVKTMTIQTAIAGKQNGSTLFTGSTQTAGRFLYTLTYAVPSPGAIALIGMAGLIARRRN